MPTCFNPMALSLRCRTCGEMMPGRSLVFLPILALGMITAIIMLLALTLMGLASVARGAAMIMGAVVAMLALYLLVRAGNVCQACWDGEKRSFSVVQYGDHGKH